MIETETRPDPRETVDRGAIDVHATSLVGEKVRGGATRFERLRRKPLGVVETVAVVVATCLMVARMAVIVS